MSLTVNSVADNRKVSSSNELLKSHAKAGTLKLTIISFYVLKLFNIESVTGSPYTHLNIPSLQAETFKQDSCSLKMPKLTWTTGFAHP